MCVMICTYVCFESFQSFEWNKKKKKSPGKKNRNTPDRFSELIVCAVDSAVQQVNQNSFMRLMPSNTVICHQKQI